MFFSKESAVLAMASIWLCSLVPGAEANFPANVSSYLNVQIPVSLREHNVSGGMEHGEAHFGAYYTAIREREHMAHPTHYTQGKLCDMPDANVTKHFGEPPFFLMADMGGCTPVSKARRAQELGAAGLVIVADHCLCQENCTDDAHCLPVLPPLLDDGSGRSISIPTMLISKGKGESIKSAMSQKLPVMMEMAWQFPLREDNVTLDLWHTPTDQITQDFLNNFSSLAMIMKDRLDFRPIHQVLDGEKLGCKDHAKDKQQACYNMCTNNGRYCQVSHHGIPGSEVVKESLRRMCLWKHYAEKGYWDYLNQFNTLCESSAYFGNEDCLKDVYKHASIDQAKVDECMKDSGDIDADDTNSLLAHAVGESKSLLATPTVLINSLPMKWELKAKTVFEFVCAAFAPGHAPHVCYACGHCGDPAACASRSPMHCDAHDGEVPEPSDTKTNKKKGGGGGGFFKFMFIVLLVGGGGFVYYKKYMEDGDGLGSYNLADALMSDSA